MSIPFTYNGTIISAVATTTTSDAYDISKRQQATVQFITSGGTTVFTIDVSNDGTNWVTSVAFHDAVGTTQSTLVTSKSVASGTAGAIIIPGFRFIRVVATVSSGTATAILQNGG